MRGFECILNICGFDAKLKPPVTLEDNYLTVEAAHMLQFLEVLEYGVNERITFLNGNSALDTWILAETLNQHHLRVVARYMALTEFNIVRETRTFLDLDLDRVARYLGDVNLCCENEMDVFDAGMLWWANNSNRIRNLQQTLFLLLSCLDFNKISSADVIKITDHHVVKEFNHVIDVLHYIIDLKENKILLSDYNKDVVEKATRLLSAKHRNIDHCPGFVVNSWEAKIKANHNYPIDKDLLFVWCNRQHYRNNLEVLTGTKGIPVKLRNCTGYVVVGYKHYIYLFGGVSDDDVQYHCWWIYDTIKQQWCCKTE